jgi:hypothetical protein
MPRFWTGETLSEFVEDYAARQGHEGKIAYAKLLVGKKTGKSYGTAELSLDNKQIASMLCELKFEKGDIRENMSFEAVSEAELQQREKKKSEAISRQRRMLDAIDIDQYLLSPDLLFETAKLDQRKYLSRSERIEVDAFLSDGSKSRETFRNDVGRGSQLNVPLAQQYLNK